MKFNELVKTIIEKDDWFNKMNKERNRKKKWKITFTDDGETITLKNDSDKELKKFLKKHENREHKLQKI